MGMIPSYEQLEALSDHDLIRRYNAAATNTVVGTAFYLEELSRRSAARENARMLEMTATLRLLTWVITGLTVVNLIAVLVPLFRI